VREDSRKENKQIRKKQRRRVGRSDFLFLKLITVFQTSQFCIYALNIVVSSM
jgi:hypothetical protein